MLAVTSIRNAGWFSQKCRTYMFSRGALELYTCTMLTSEWRARCSTRCTWTEISSKFSLLSHCYRPVTNLCLGVYASPSSVPRVNPHCSPSLLEEVLYICFGLFLLLMLWFKLRAMYIHSRCCASELYPQPDSTLFCSLFPCMSLSLIRNNSPASASQVLWLQSCTTVLTTYTAKLEFQFSCLGCKKHRKGLEEKVFVQFSRAEPALRDRVIMISPCSGTLENAVSASLSGTNSNDKNWSDG